MMACAHSPQFYCSFSESCLAYVPRRSIEQHLFSSVSLPLFPSFSLFLFLSLVSSSFGIHPPHASVSLSLCLSPQPLSSYVSSPLPSIASFSLPASFFPTRRDSRIEFRRTTRCGIGEKRGEREDRGYRNARHGIYKL